MKAVVHALYVTFPRENIIFPAAFNQYGHQGEQAAKEFVSIPTGAEYKQQHTLHRGCGTGTKAAIGSIVTVHHVQEHKTPARIH